MNHLERQYLIAAYGLARDDPMHTFNEDEIANHLDLDHSQPGYTDRFISLTQYHLAKGFLAPGHKGSGMGRRTLKITREGMEEARRLADPVEQQKELRWRFLRSVYKLAGGNPAKFVYWRDVAPELGWESDNREHEEQGIALAEYADSSKLITIEANEGTIYRITAKGVDDVEDNKREPDGGSTFNIYGSVQGSVIGTHNTAELTNSFDFRSIEERIEREGGEDKEELKRALASVERLLEHGEYLDRGALSQFSDAMENHSWFTGAVMSALLGFATQAAG